MKRSRINALLRDAEAFIQQQGFFLPPFARWTPADWRGKGEEVREIVDHGLGWDITDFGQGDYAKCGLLLFTIRNGDAADLARGTGRLYAEKLLIVEPGQITPLHFHWKKTEDIINRGGGKLVLRLHNVAADESLADSDVTVSLDGVRRTVKAGSTVTLSAGESITLKPCHYHSFWAEEQRVMAGEVSMVNDDHTDNRFFEKVGRFPVIEEDESPLYLLATDYPDYYGVATKSSA